MSKLSSWIEKAISPKITKLLTSALASQIEDKKLYVTVGNYCIVLGIVDVVDLNTEPDPRKTETDN